MCAETLVVSHTPDTEKKVPQKLMGLQDWIRSIGSYEETLKSTTEHDGFETADLQESLAYAYYNAAMRSNNSHQFKQLLDSSIASYEKAARIYTDSSTSGARGRSLHCNAMVPYLRSWLTLDAIEKKKQLEEAWSILRESLKSLEEAGNGLEYGITFNRLSIIGGLRFYFQWDFQNRKKSIEDLASFGEQAIKFLTFGENTEELVRAYVKTAEFLGAFADQFLDIDDGAREDVDRKARAYMTKALELSKEDAVHELTSCFPPACWVVLDWDLDKWISHCEAELEYRKKTNEAFQMGWMEDWLSEFQFEKSSASDDPVARYESARNALQLAEAARINYSVLSLKSPRAHSFWVEAPDPEFLSQLADWEDDAGRRQELLQKAWKASERLLKSAEDSGMPEAVSYAHSIFSKIVTSTAHNEPVREKCRTLLEIALEHANKSIEIDEQILPFNYYRRGLDLARLANIESELFEQTKQSGLRRELLEKAIQHKETGITIYSKFLEFYEKRFRYPEQFVRLGRLESEAGDLLIRLNGLAKSENYLRRSLHHFEKAIDFFGRPDLAARVAESCWKSAKAYNLLGEYSSAADMFDEASTNYRTASQKIPQLKSLYLDHSTYMEAMSEIERARHHHQAEEYAEAANCYRVASKLHNSTARWNSLAPIYSAWSHLEEAEDLSRMEYGEAAVEALRKASAIFGDNKKALYRETRRLEDHDKQVLLAEGMAWSALGSEFCKARASFEEAKILDQKGDHLASSQRYRRAAETLEKTLKERDIRDRAADLEFVSKLSRAWEMMTRAEYDASPQEYLQASRLFEEARHFSRNEKAGWLVLGHSHFCKALESGIILVDKGSLELVGSIRKNFETAASYYARGGSQNALRCAEASKLLYEALAKMILANREEDSAKRAMLLSMAETVLLSSADSFTKAGFTGKREEVLRLVGKASLEKTVALSLTEILHAPSLISSNQSIGTHLPAPNAQRDDWFEQAYIHQNVEINRVSTESGPLVALDVTLVNAGRVAARLASLEGLAREDLEVVTPPEEYPVSGKIIDLRGRALRPLNSLSFKIVLRPRFQGFFILNSIVNFIDENGNSKSQQLGPIDVLASPIVEFLASCFSADYNKAKLSQSFAGWRSLMEIVSSMKISKSNLYGDARYGHTFSRPIERLISSGLIESRIFPGERGRGGRILKIRVCYDKGPIRRLLDQ